VTATTASCCRGFPVIGDRTRLLQIVENLLANSRRYTPSGGSIWVRLYLERGSVNLDVKDDGQGIEPIHLESIFNMFSRGRETEETQGGLGVGLALVKMLIEKHEGHLSAVSAGLDQGTTFTISLPVVAIPEGMSTDPEPIEALDQTDAKAFTIVLVEDDEDARSTMETLLQLDGHQVIPCGDGLSGLDAIQQRKPDFALLSNMPNLRCRFRVGLRAIDGRLCRCTSPPAALNCRASLPG
jgi:two-component system CheB/CheR fusion protein